MPLRYEVRGPLGDSRVAPGVPNQYRWAVWDRVRDCPVSHAATREWARLLCEEANHPETIGGGVDDGVDELDQLPTILRILRGN